MEDGKFISAAGVSAGIDMALHLGARLTSEELAKEAQLGIEYDPRPPFGPIDWSTVDRQAYLPAQIQMVEHLLADHPDLVARLTG